MEELPASADFVPLQVDQVETDTTGVAFGELGAETLYTVQQSGVYQVLVQFDGMYATTEGGDETMEVNVLVNGAAKSYGVMRSDAGCCRRSFQTTAMLELEAGDTLSLSFRNFLRAPLTRAGEKTSYIALTRVSL